MDDDTIKSKKSFIDAPITVFLAVLQLAFIIGIIFSIYKMLEPPNLASVEYNYDQQPQITIDDLANAVPNLSNTEITNTERMLFWAINSNSSEIDLPDIYAKVRSDTVKTMTFAEQDISYFSLILDIPDLQQSYQVYYMSSDDAKYLDPGETAIVLCVKDSDLVIYPDFNCQDSYEERYNGVARNAIVASLLPYLDFDQFELAIGNDLKQITIALFQPEPSKTVTDKYIEEVKSTIASLGVSPDIFTYKIQQPLPESYDQY